jgi:hypothetical protein
MNAVGRLFILIGVLVSAAGLQPAEALEGSVPFERLGHLIVVKAGINGSPEEFNFVVDTGGVACVDKDLARELGLKERGIMAKIDTLALSGLKIGGVFCFTNFDFGHLRALGTPIHGMIGSNLMERFRVTFDFRAGLVTFSDDTTSAARPDSALVFSFRNHPVNSAPLVEFKIGKEAMEGMIDTGQPYPLVIPLSSFDDFDQSAFSGCLRSTGLMKKWPLTHADHNYLVRLKSVTFGDMSIENVICLFGELPPLLSMPLIGTDLLSQFEMIIDYPNDEMLLVPYPGLEMKQNEFSLGLNLGLSDEDSVIVEGILEGSPAAQWLDVGDIVLSFDSREATARNLIELIRMMNDDSVESLQLEIKRGDESEIVELHKHLLF